MHADLVGAYAWQPELVWRLTLSEAIRYRAARVRAIAAMGQVLAAVAMGDKRALAEVERLGRTAPEMTLAQKFGTTMAREVAELEERQRKWLAERKGS